jgi:hypothetical protein
MFGSTGITFSFHTCSSSHKTDMKVFPEFFGIPAGCCCGEGIASESPDPVNTQPWIDMPECCKTNHAFFKVTVFAFTDPIQLSPAVTFLFNINEGNPEFSSIPDRDIFRTGLPLPDPSPPLYGNDLVHFLNQAKIPFPVCA